MVQQFAKEVNLRAAAKYGEKERTRTMESYGYYNGEYAPAARLMLPALDRGVYFGDGVYEALRVERGRFFALEEHLERLHASLDFLRIEFEMPRETLVGILREVAMRAGIESLLLYFQITRGTAPRGHAFPEGARANLLVMTKDLPLADVSQPRRVIALPDERWGYCNIKTLNLLPNVLAAQRAKERGCSEAVFHRDGVVTECSSSNLLLLKDGAVKTHPADRRILPGVTRKHFLALARSLGISVFEEPFTLEEAYDADELLIVSTSAHGLLIDTMEDRPLGGRAPALVARLQRAYREYFQDHLVLE